MLPTFVTQQPGLIAAFRIQSLLFMSALFSSLPWCSCYVASSDETKTGVYGVFLNPLGLALQERGPTHFVGHCQEANCPVPRFHRTSSSVSTFIRQKNRTTTFSRLSLKRRLLRKSSPHHRIILHLSPVAYSEDSPPGGDGVEPSPVMTRTIFSRRQHVAPTQTQMNNHIAHLGTRVRGSRRRFT